MQLSYSRLWDGYATDAEAKAARDARYKAERRSGRQAHRWVLKNQLRKYASFGVEDGRSCDVFMLDVQDVGPR